MGGVSVGSGQLSLKHRPPYILEKNYFKKNKFVYMLYLPHL
jgi:hypothetical protein